MLSCKRDDNLITCKRDEKLGQGCSSFQVGLIKSAQPCNKTSSC
jgi:hypothetical protein